MVSAMDHIICPINFFFAYSSLHPSDIKVFRPTINIETGRLGSIVNLQFSGKVLNSGDHDNRRCQGPTTCMLFLCIDFTEVFQRQKKSSSHKKESGSEKDPVSCCPAGKLERELS